MSEISLKLTGDNSEFRSMLDKSASDATRFAGQIADKVGDKFYGLRDVSNVIASALGLNLNEIATNLARAITGMSKEEEEAYKKLDQLTAAAAEASIKNMRAQLTEEQRYQLTLKERAALQEKLDRAVAVTAVEQVKVAEMRIKLEEKNAEIIAYQTKVAQENKKAEEERQKTIEQRLTAERKASQDREAAELALMNLADRRKKLLDEENAVQQLLRDGAMEQKAAEEKLAFYATEKNKLIAEEAKHRKAVSLSAEEEYELLRLSEKAHKGLTVDENERLKLLRLQKEEKRVHVELEDLLEKLVQGTLNPEERKRLDTLDKQDAKLKEQIATGQQLISDAASRRAAEAEVTHELEAQVAANERMTHIGVEGAPDYASMSTGMLQGLVQRYTQQLQQTGRSGLPISLANPGTDYGDFLTASLAQSQLGNINSELALRAEVQGYVNRFGTVAAQQRFGDTVVNRALRDIQSTQQQTTNVLTTISRQLNASGLFPVTAGAATH